MSLTSHGSEQQVIEQLNRLIAHHRAAVDACDAAASRLDDVEQRAEMRHFVSDHLRNVEELSRCVEALGGRATAEKAALTKSRGDIVAIERDEPLLSAILADEENMARIYAGIEPERSERVAMAIERAAAAVQRHRNWLRQRVQS